MLLHGGGWHRSLPAYRGMVELGETIQVGGYATVAIGYDPGARGFRQIEQIYDEAKERYPEIPICAIGQSAGGHLALMLATREPDLDCVINVAGPTDLTTLASKGPLKASSWRWTPSAGTLLPSSAQPSWPTRFKARVLMVMAANDDLVPIEQGEELAELLPDSELIVLPAGSAPFLHSGVDQAAFAEANLRQQEFLAVCRSGWLNPMGLIPARIANKPQYVFHPRRALRRMRYRAEGGAQREVATLPWGLPLEVYRSDAIGFSIATAGVFDPCVTETLHRLIDPGDLVVDVGANVGYISEPGGGSDRHPGNGARLRAAPARLRDARTQRGKLGVSG